MSTPVTGVITANESPTSSDPALDLLLRARFGKSLSEVEYALDYYQGSIGVLREREIALRRQGAYELADLTRSITDAFESNQHTYRFNLGTASGVVSLFATTEQGELSTIYRTTTLPVQLFNSPTQILLTWARVLVAIAKGQLEREQQALLQPSIASLTFMIGSMVAAMNFEKLLTLETP